MDFQQQLLSGFMERISSNPIVGPAHISLFVALLELSKLHGGCELRVKRADVMPLARIAGISTYHRILNDLVDWDCISYVPKFDRKGSRIRLINGVGTSN